MRMATAGSKQNNLVSHAELSLIPLEHLEAELRSVTLLNYWGGETIFSVA